MSFERKHQGLTKRTQKLIEGGESLFVDFKKKAEGLASDDLVAFANTDSGGDILIGVAEGKRDDGSQFGEIVGHRLDDESALTIVNKAISCVPPVPIKLYAENVSAASIIRVHVPAGRNRPYSTPKGIYCIREGSRNRPLQPSELLEMFLDAEGRAFAARFEHAAGTVVDSISGLEAVLYDRIESISGELGWADSKVGDTRDSIDTVLAQVSRLQEEIADIATRVRVLFRQDKRDDPVKERARAALLEQAKAELSKNRKMAQEILKGGEFTAQLSGRMAIELDKSDLEEILVDAAREVSANSEGSSQPNEGDEAGSDDDSNER